MLLPHHRQHLLQVTVAYTTKPCYRQISAAQWRGVGSPSSATMYVWTLRSSQLCTTHSQHRWAWLGIDSHRLHVSLVLLKASPSSNLAAALQSRNDTLRHFLASRLHLLFLGRARNLLRSQEPAPWTESYLIKMRSIDRGSYLELKATRIHPFCRGVPDFSSSCEIARGGEMNEISCSLHQYVWLWDTVAELGGCCVFFATGI